MSALCVLDGDRPREAVVGYLCGWHRDRLDFLTREIGTLWCEMALVLDGSLPSDWSEKTRHVKIAEAPAPIDLTAASLRDPRTKASRSATPLDQSEPLPAIPQIVASWVLLVAEERPLAVTLPSGLIGQLDLLRRHHEWCSAQPWVDDYSAELEDMRKAMRLAVRDSSGHVIGVCDLPDDVGGECGGSLLRENGSETVRCLRCRSAWSSAEHRALLMRRLDARHAHSA